MQKGFCLEVLSLIYIKNLIRTIPFLFLLSCSKKNPVAVHEKNNYIQVRDQFQKRLTEGATITGFLDSIKNVTVKKKLLFDASYFYRKKGDSVKFRFWNSHCFQISKISGDTSGLAEANWDLADFYRSEDLIDSAYFHYKRASELYLKKDDLSAASMLLNMAILQKNIKDYTGSEVTTARALGILANYDDDRKSYIGFNNLAIIYNQLGDYKQALNYHQRAMDYSKKLEDNILAATTLNNMGVVYENDKRYSEAIKKFRQALKSVDLKKENIRLYAMLQDNLAYSFMKSGVNWDVQPLMIYALKIRDSIGHDAGVTMSKIHMGEFYLQKGDSTSALNNFRQANQIATRTNNHRDILSSLMFLAKVDRENSNSYLQNYIILNDSLQNQERKIRNKFARIHFETDEFIAQNHELGKQKKWILTTSGSVLSAFILIFILWRQKARNKTLLLEREQQKVNEEIYNLLLDQDLKVEEGRNVEKERISKELHDGVLGNLYGIRFSLSNLNSRADEKAIGTREDLLDRLRGVEEEIRLISRDLQKTHHLEETSYVTVLSNLFETLQDSVEFDLILNYENEIRWERISSKAKMNLYRIIQEALLNAHKYSNATEFRASFRTNHDFLQMILKDNGKGFNLAQSTKGIGVRNMESRTKMLNGRFYISSDSTGTEITIEMPLS